MRLWSVAKAVGPVMLLLGACGEPVREGHGPAWDPTETTDTGTDGSTGEEASTGFQGSGSTGLVETSGDDANDGSCPAARVIVSAGSNLNVRRTPSTEYAPIGALPNGTVVEVLDEVRGQWVGDSDVWFEIAFGEQTGFVFAGYAECTFDEPSQLEPVDAAALAIRLAANVG